MPQHLAAIAILVPDYDAAIAFYVGVLGFVLIEDSFIPEQNKRWVVVAPPGTIPRTTSGKVRRSETRARFQAGTLLNGGHDIHVDGSVR